MKLAEALDIINGSWPASRGFLVAMTETDGRIEGPNYFPDIRAGELPFKTESEAWVWAERFCHATSFKRPDRNWFYNIHVVFAHTYHAVPAAQEKMLRRK